MSPATKAKTKKKAAHTETVFAGFPPGSEVQIHPSWQTTVEAQRKQRPIGRATQKTKVGKDGGVALSVPEPGVYSIACLVDEAADSWRYVLAVVK